MNSDLKDKKYTCPDEIIDELNVSLSKYQSGGDTKGFKRAKEIVEKKKITYQQMKRIKNYFDNYNGDGNNSEYQLNGGNKMRKWVNKALKVDRDNIDKVKSAKKDGGLDNVYLKTHEKDNNKRPMNVNIPKIKGNKTVYENEIKQIKYLIGYLDNTNKTI